ncbi:putative signal transducing protein [Carboxylicivirga linearis]|uniref:DUF2007 domain-containing protein n=1 Tax=Carboxylicivirga linearis TaxID=1628157 RepID=A0ABS5JUU3_9BACT|nr:DUF2007 domain-containing protein [Carboxylicivirga linearis]MBS2098688.1 DUF2007 domain-containing protein [Carboxylicivirga linearis]
MSDVNNEKMVIAFSGNPMDAIQIKELLESHNIEASVLNGYTSTIAPHIVPEANVMIFQKDMEEAQELMKYMSLNN